jgi:Gpi18-like mannosyltransferase
MFLTCLNRCWKMRKTNDFPTQIQPDYIKLDTRRAIRVSYFVLAVSICFLFLFIHALQGSSPFTPSKYNSYVLQAMQWRKGKIALEYDVSHLELAIYNGEYYVSFPPVPTIPIYILSFIFDKNIPDTLLLQIYALLSCLLLHRVFLKRFGIVHSSTLSFLCCFSSSLLPILQNGAVWYQAQVLGFLFMVWAIERMNFDKPTVSLFLYALSVGCRPFNAIYGPLLMIFYIKRKRNFRLALRKLLPSILLGLSVAFFYGYYNYIRFGNILEFGHNYLPEFSFQGGQQFSFLHLSDNIRRFVFGSPIIKGFKGIELEKFGFSLFIANPLFIVILLVFIYNIIKKSITQRDTLIIVFCVFHMFMLLLHRTGGGYQYGARYYVDCLPYCYIYLMSKPKAPKWIKLTSLILLILGLISSTVGSCFVYLD